MLKPILDITNVNVALGVFGTYEQSATTNGRGIPVNGSIHTGIFILAYGYVSAKLQQEWYLGEACEFQLHMNHCSVEMHSS